ncbi:MAG: hypothetical protein B7Z60_06975 [Ferrovum sp. 37-45-19]|jgi:hypothetical protein|uniref:DUF4156 domain-containing protein n=1 Tax=Ferrovum sp. JA12 TaxID=1356299 RepID=UPI0007039CAB|nr:DUF4156 domain-containing protein [Ferrovum sp. JA12]OYV78756.1 MAG: hypothetical protein B7Z65_08870 [Ferrovum sp. 21-44-67]OYV93938.1 MAG: hypothetical protein B7Z60_06975 [Ferrovum sp. 37-45-19]OZB31994.1 MAG: hypothetical protein B7X47_07685 [Ferrovum sp. 34-44-207]HQT81996.1 DUF4156 domain-containing protein [Ferrovaceae bacterium]KRH78979.1 hypothetical protein FERRO_00400 [Ferrovum sp. JA12]
MNKLLVKLSHLIILSTLLASCSNSFIAEKTGADEVRMLYPNQVSSCDFKGKTRVSVIDKIGFIDRDPTAVEQNLIKLARNNAIEMHGNVITTTEVPVEGQQSFNVYYCKDQ